MLTAGIISVLLAVTLLVVFRMGRDSEVKTELKSDVATGEKTNEILQKQRDDRIVSIDDADRLFDTLKKD